MARHLGMKVAAKAIGYLAKKRNPEEMIALGRKVKRTIHHVKQGADAVNQIANTVGKVASTVSDSVNSFDSD